MSDENEKRARNILAEWTRDLTDETGLAAALDAAESRGRTEERARIQPLVDAAKMWAQFGGRGGGLYDAVRVYLRSVAEDEALVDRLMRESTPERKTRPLTRPSALSHEEQSARKPPAPDSLVGALQDRIHETSGKLIKATPLAKLEAKRALMREAAGEHVDEPAWQAALCAPMDPVPESDEEREAVAEAKASSAKIAEAERAAKCPACRGSGKGNWMDCEACAGTGRAKGG